MSSNLRIVRLRDFIEINPQGDLDFAKLNDVVKEVTSIPGAFVDFDVLVDTRGGESHLSAVDIWELARDVADALHAKQSKGFTAKIAVICPVDEFDHAKFFELCGQNQGLNVRAFTTFEDMFHWLGESSPAL